MTKLCPQRAKYLYAQGAVGTLMFDASGDINDFWKEGVEIPSRSDWTAGTGSSRLLSYNTQNASVDLFILKTRGAGVGSKTRTSDAIPF